ncbi:MAG: hypothetical protein M1831_005031 [Alyxoria varia]|nr:MAG: hypothetical protein M1831_005031 [Alyxoria varia]
MFSSGANKPLPPLPTSEDFTPKIELARDNSATKSSTSGSSSESFLSRIKRVMSSRRNQSRSRRQKRQSTQVQKPEMVDKGTQTETPPRPTCRPRDDRRSARTEGSQGTQRKIDLPKSSNRPAYLSSRPSFAQSSQHHGSGESSGGDSGQSAGGPGKDSNSSNSSSKMDTGAGEYPMVGPNLATSLVHFNQSKVASLGTYESRYSDRTLPASTSNAIGRRETMRRANSDTSLVLPASPSSSVLNANNAMFKEAGRERHVKGMKHQGYSEESPKGRSGGRHRLRNDLSVDSNPSPLRREVRSSPTPSPDGIFLGGKKPTAMASTPFPKIHRAPVEGYFELPEPERMDAVPDHMHGSPLCPLNPKYYKGQQFQCPLHGRISWPTDASSDSNSVERYSEHKRNISDDLSETHFDASGFFGPDHARGSPLCPAFNKSPGPGNRCLWHGKKMVVRSQIEDDM